MDKKLVAVIGGGQLARMLIEASLSMGNITIAVMDPSDKCPAALINSNCHFKGGFKSDLNGDNIFKFLQAVETRFQQAITVVTYEIEHIDASGLKLAVDRLNASRSQDRVNVVPSIENLQAIQDKYRQKCKFDQSLMGKFEAVKSRDDLQKFIAEFGYPVMLKSRNGAYDGRGNFAIRSEGQIDLAIKTLCGSSEFQSDALYVEQWVNYTKELAVMVAKDAYGVCCCYPVVETIQKDNICHLVMSPAEIGISIQKKALQVAESIVAALPGAGLYGVELFLSQDGRVLFNEIAPRPHNSGHYTIEACETSQFQQHLRIVLGLPMGSTKMKVPAAVMMNLIGGPDSGTKQEGGNMAVQQAICARSIQSAGSTLHWYCKAESRPGRKLGHVTVTDQSIGQCLEKVGYISGQDVYTYYDLHKKTARVAIIMGSDSDLSVMRDACTTLDDFGVKHFTTVVSAHRTPERLMDFSRTAHLLGFQVIIAGAGGAAHLPGMVASLTPLPVIGVPVALKHLDGVDSLYSIVQMPRGVPCATVAINNSTNAALLALRILATSDKSIMKAIVDYQLSMKDTVLAKAEKMEANFNLNNK